MNDYNGSVKCTIHRYMLNSHELSVIKAEEQIHMHKAVLSLFYSCQLVLPKEKARKQNNPTV